MKLFTSSAIMVGVVPDALTWWTYYCYVNARGCNELIAISHAFTLNPLH